MRLVKCIVFCAALNLCYGLSQTIPAHAQDTGGVYYDSDGNVVYDESRNEPQINRPSSPESPLPVTSPLSVRQPTNTDPVQPVTVPNEDLSANLQAAVAAEEVAGFPPTDLYFGKDWSQALLTSKIGEKGLFAGDFDGNGRVEIIVTNTYYWVVLEYDPLKNTYEQVWVSPMFDKLRNNTIYPSIAKLALYQRPGDKGRKLFTAAVDGRVYIHDMSNRVEEAIWQSPITNVQSMIIADGDNDGEDELILLNEQEMVFLDPNTGSVKSRIPYGARDLTAGDADNDGIQEIVLSDGRIISYDGVNVVEEWDFSDLSNVFPVIIGDADGDGENELISRTRYSFAAYDVTNRQIKWEAAATNGYSQGAQLVDCNQDGIADLLYGDGQWGYIHCYSGVTQQEIWNVRNPDHGVSSVLLYDTDSDGRQEIVWGAGASSSGPDHLHISEVPSGTPEWRSVDANRPLYGTLVDDVDADGEDEIVTMSLESNNGYDDGILTVYDAVTKDMEWQSAEDLFGSRAWTGLRDLATGQLDDDPQKEIVVAASDLYDGALYIIDGITHEIEHAFIYPDFTTFQAVEVADIDGDGDQEIVATESDNVHFINPRTGEVERSYLDTVDTYIFNMYLADMDGDGALDIVLQAWISTIYTPVQEYFKIINPRTGAMFGYQTNELYSVATMPTESGQRDLIFGSLNGEVVIRDGQTFSEKGRWPVIDESITSLCTHDVDADGHPEVIFTANDKWGVFDINREKLLYLDTRSGFYGTMTDIIPGDTDNDGLFDVIIGSSFSVSSFEVANSEIRQIKAWTADPVKGWKKTVFRRGEVIRFIVEVEVVSDKSVPVRGEGSAVALKFGSWAFDIPPATVMSHPGKTVLTWDIPYPDNDSRFLSLGEATITVQSVNSEPSVTSAKFWLAP